MSEADGELFAERLRLEARALSRSEGASDVTDELDKFVTTKLASAWEDVDSAFGPHERAARSKAIDMRGRRSIGESLTPVLMEMGAFHNNEVLLSLVEAEHEVLVTKAQQAEQLVQTIFIDNEGTEEDVVDTADDTLYPYDLIHGAPEKFRLRVNEIFESHDLPFRLTTSSRLVPVASLALNDAVVEPVLYLLHGQPRFAGAESAYQKALAEIRGRDAGDAITDAGTALQAALTALGCPGGTIGAQVAVARSNGLLRGNDTPLTESIVKAANWVAALRNDGEAHNADAGFDLMDAWMVVHVVGALIIRLADAASRGNN